MNIHFIFLSSESQNILLDCGEGTYGQLVRFFGDTVDREIANINAIYISHLHADHHIGLLGVLQGRRRALNTLNLNFESVSLFAPKQILAWLNFYDRYFENVCQEFKLIPNSDFVSICINYVCSNKTYFFVASKRPLSTKVE